MPYVRNEEWLCIFGGYAERIARDISPRSVLDAGCAMGFLVECLRDRGIEAFGVDVSDYAIQCVREDVRPYCWVGSVLDALPQRYDLIVCIEVLEHLTAQECERAAANFAQASDDILFSSTPDDFSEPTHINVQPPDYWAGLFARHGFIRDVDYDATFITPWAMRFRRSDAPAHRVVGAYERRLWQVSEDLRKTRAAALDTRNVLADREAHLELARARLNDAQQQQQAAKQRVAAILSSPGWRFVQRVGRVRARLAPPDSRRERWWKSIVNKLAG